MRIGSFLRGSLYKVYSKIPLIEWLICLLCELEMQAKFFSYGTSYRHRLHKEGVKVKLPNETWEEFQARECYTQIPKNDLYCSECPYWDESGIARALLGQQLCGYCHYMGKGDFSYAKPTEILWDMCKECGMYEEIEIEDDND